MRKGGATPPPNIPKFRGDFRPSVKLLKKSSAQGAPRPPMRNPQKAKPVKFPDLKMGNRGEKKRKPDCRGKRGKPRILALQSRPRPRKMGEC
ncbi:MAG: hypothetical protein DBY30_05295 [Verrucomicrobia bacterium]|nr:MAG: hypothetical protein DBY30_05295 [Verrucomicrobiota bacterium]